MFVLAVDQLLPNPTIDIDDPHATGGKRNISTAEILLLGSRQAHGDQKGAVADGGNQEGYEQHTAITIPIGSA